MVILGGWNDKYTSEEILNGVKRTVNKCRSLYPNARIHIGMAAFDTDASRFDKAAILKAYEKRQQRMAVIMYGELKMP